MVDEIIWGMAYNLAISDTTKTQYQHYCDLLGERESEINSRIKINGEVSPYKDKYDVELDKLTGGK